MPQDAPPGPEIMTPAEIAARGPAMPPPGDDPLARARSRMVETGHWGPAQTMGRRYAIGCVALEITQRCNLDCTLCYLSENAEAVKDLPLAEVFRRIDMIREAYGPHTDVQVTGGDPTLRRRDELVAIVRRVRERGMRASLFTNGIRATRDLLAELAEAGLVDVAFHVDTTQRRKGYATEAALNRVRRDYVERARGLPLSVFFNTTVHDGNIDEIPEVVRFFVANADVVRVASFQLQAATGRGIAGRRGAAVSIESVAARISAGAGAAIAFDRPGVGYPACNRYALTLVANGRVHDLFDDRALAAALLAATAGVQFDRTRPRRAVAALAGCLLRRPRLLAQGAGWAAGKLWAMRRDLVAARGRAHKLSFFIHNFMDACGLERNRIDACAFMVATADGPLSMCLHNAKRDSYLLKPLRLPGAPAGRVWNPLSGTLGDDAPDLAARIAAAAPAQRVPLKGRRRRERLSASR